MDLYTCRYLSLFLCEEIMEIHTPTYKVNTNYKRMQKIYYHYTHISEDPIIFFGQLLSEIWTLFMPIQS